MTKPIDLLTAAEIQRAYDRTLAATSAATRALIEAGRTGSETRAKAGRLVLDYLRTRDAFSVVVAEMDARKRYHGSTKRIIRRSA